MTRVLAPGVRLHLLSTARFTTSYCRVVLHRDLGAEATSTAVLAQVLQSATANHPTHKALADRLGDLYGAALHAGVHKLGDRQVLVASLDWATAHVPRARGQLAAGLGLLREVLADPKRDAHGLDAEIVATERSNHARALQGRKDDKARHAMRSCLAAMCAGEAYALDAEGREEDLAAVDGASLAALHARLLARAPVEIFLVADLTPAEAVAAIRAYLLWPTRAAKPARVPPVASVRPARPRPRALVEHDAVSQGKLVLGWRGQVRPGTAAAYAAELWAGVLGGGSYARLFKVVREEHGLCYYAGAGWHRAKGLLLVQTGVDPANEAKARRLIVQLTRDTAAAGLDPAAREAHLLAVEHGVASMLDSPKATAAWYEERLAIGGAESPRAHLAALRAVTPAAVRAVGRRVTLDTTFSLRPAGSALPKAGSALPKAGSALPKAGGR
ncbi:MAG: insulinase family protein [Planctomycetota bacterium]|nr:insulinase family protein [Planctomycetota bacterium]